MPDHVAVPRLRGTDAREGAVGAPMPGGNVKWLTDRRRRKHCPHSRLRGIYGDEINRTPGFRRLICRDCCTPLDGPVALAESRRLEWVRGGEFL